SEAVRLFVGLSNEYPGVRLYFRDLLIIIPEFIQFYRNQGGHFEERLALARRKLSAAQGLLVLAPEDESLHSEVAGAYSDVAAHLSALGRSFEARDACREALRLDPENATTLNNVAWVLVTTPDQTLRDPATGVALARKAVAKSP